MKKGNDATVIPYVANDDGIVVLSSAAHQAVTQHPIGHYNIARIKVKRLLGAGRLVTLSRLILFLI